jgi:hypothetical protein
MGIAMGYFASLFLVHPNNAWLADVAQALHDIEFGRVIRGESSA